MEREWHEWVGERKGNGARTAVVGLANWLTMGRSGGTARVCMVGGGRCYYWKTVAVMAGLLYCRDFLSRRVEAREQSKAEQHSSIQQPVDSAVGAAESKPAWLAAAAAFLPPFWSGPPIAHHVTVQIRPSSWLLLPDYEQGQYRCRATPTTQITTKNYGNNMSERGNFRAGGRGGGGRGRGGGGDRGGRGGGGAGAKDGGERKKENILDLNKYMDKAVTVKFNGGREGEFGSCLFGKRNTNEPDINFPFF